jgi:putative ABC transport system substrate-binding protein
MALFGGAVAGCPMMARAQQSRTPVIGFLSLGSPDPSSGFGAAFRAGLAEAGYLPGQNAAIESRWANNQAWLLPQLAAADEIELRRWILLTFRPHFLLS